MSLDFAFKLHRDSGFELIFFDFRFISGSEPEFDFRSDFSKFDLYLTMSLASTAAPASIAISTRFSISNANMTLTSIFDSILNSNSNLDSKLKLISRFSH